MTATELMITDLPDANERAPGGGRGDPGTGPLVVVLIATFMTFLDFFITNVALPSLQTDLHAGPAVVQLVVAGYGLTFAVSMIGGGRLGDIHGRKRVFGVGLVLFTLTSAMCGLAPDAALLVTFRVLQGAAAALMTPQVLAILGTVYTGRRRARAFACYGFAMGVAGMSGQLLGGVLVDLDLAGSQWRGIFLINVPVGLVALAFLRVVPESRGERSRLDLGGTALVTAGLVALVLPLVEGRQYGWPWWTWTSLVAAPVLLVGFVRHQRARTRSARPVMVDVSTFRDRTYAVGSAVALVFALVPPSFFLVLALYLQSARGFSAVFSGTLFAALGVGFLVAMALAEAAARRLGRQVLALGAVVVGAGCVALAAAAGTHSSAALLPGLAVVGLGIGFVLVPVTSAALAHVAPHRAGSASGVLATAQQVGGAVGVAVVGSVFFAAAGAGTPAELTHAFRVAVLVCAALTLATAILVQVLPAAPKDAPVGQ